MKIRRGFVASKGKVLIALDISQQELRVIANLSGEDKLKDAFKNEEDIHKLTASGMFEIPIDKVSKKQRDIGKTMNYSLLYGISAFGLADRLKVGRDEAFTFIQKFWDAYPKIEKFFDEYLKNAQEKGYAETFFGRRRSAKNLSSKNFRIRESAKRELVNFPVQGTSADLMKMAMIAVDNELSGYKDLGPEILLQVHDELVIEVKNVSDDRVSNFIDKMIKIMENVVEFDVPLKVESKIGDNWSQIK
jgi:DNA polymerase-1